MNKLDLDYQALLQDILDNGHQKGDRTGTGTISVFGRQIRHKMSDGFPLLTTKKMYFKGIVTELLWFLRGDTNIKFLVDNDCHIWDGDAYKAYENAYEKDNSIGLSLLVARTDGKTSYRKPTKEQFIGMIQADDEFANKWGELGPVYGKQWRSWTYQTNEWYDGKNHYDEESKTIDQIANLIRDLKTNPDSRRLMVNAWNVGELDSMVLPPCHYGFQVYTRELSLEERTTIFENSSHSKHDNLIKFESIGELDKVIPKRAISLMWNQRSVDTFLGLPFNIASYGLLLEIIAKEVNMVPDELIGNLGDVHLYSNHIEQAKEQIGIELDKIERINYGVDVLGYESLLDYGHSQNEDELITTLCDEWGVPKRTREPYPLPKLVINDEFWNPDASLIEQIEHIEISDFEIRDYQSHPAIKAPLSN